MRAQPSKPAAWLEGAGARTRAPDTPPHHRITRNTTILGSITPLLSHSGVGSITDRGTFPQGWAEPGTAAAGFNRYRSPARKFKPGTRHIWGNLTGAPRGLCGQRTARRAALPSARTDWSLAPTLPGRRGCPPPELLKASAMMRGDNPETRNTAPPPFGVRRFGRMNAVVQIRRRQHRVDVDKAHALGPPRLAQPRFPRMTALSC